MSPAAYAAVLAANVRAARSRAGLQQIPTAARMRALGYTAWQRQTVASIENGRRRVTAEEILGLAIALETIPARLTGVPDEDRSVELPSGMIVPVSRLSFNDRSIRWDGDEPVLVTPTGPDEAARRNAAEVAQWVQHAQEDGADITFSVDPEELSHRRPAVVAAIVTSPVGVLVGKRIDASPPWTFIAGEMEPGELAEDTAIREVKEETGLEVTVGDVIGQRRHPRTDRRMIYMAARPVRGTKVIVGDRTELSEVRWVGLAEADELLPGMFEPVREHLARELGEGT